MAKAKTAKKGAPAPKKPKKNAGKPKPSAKSSASRKKKAAPIALSVEEKRRFLKPLTGFGELIARLVDTWKAHGSKVKVPGLSPARLGSLLRKAERASQREEATRTALEAKLSPLADARLRAEHEAWKSALNLHAMVKSAARTDPGIALPFAFFADALVRKRAGGAQAEPKEEGAGGDQE